MPIEFQLIEEGGGLTNRAIASWSRGIGGFTASFDVKHRIGKGSYKKFNTTDTSVTVDGIKPGKTFEVKVRAVGVGFPVKKSAFVTATAVAPSLPEFLEGEQIVANVSGLTIKPVNNTQAVLEWESPAIEKLNNLVAVIRHSSETDGTGTFANSVNLAQVPASANAATVPLMNGEYIIKLKDQTTKKTSFTEVSVVLNIPDATPSLLVETRREHTDTPPFQGEKRGVFYSNEYSALVLDGDETIDEVLGNIDDLSQMDFFGNRLSTGEYEFPATKTLPGKFEVTLDRIISNSGLYPSDAIDDRSALLDSWTDFDGLQAEDTSAAIYFRSSDEIPVDEDFLLEADPDFFLLEDGNKLLQESTVRFGDWTILDKTTFVGRTFQFKAELEATHPDQTPQVQELGYQLSIPSRTENSALIASGAGAYTVTFANAFYEEPAIGVTAFNMASGDYYEVTSASRTGFTVHFKNSSNSSVNRNFQYVAAGFGSEQT